MALSWHASTWGFLSASQNCYLPWHCSEGQPSPWMRHGEAAPSLFWRQENSRKLLRAQLGRPLLRTRTSVTAGLGWNIIQAGTRLVRALGIALCAWELGEIKAGELHLCTSWRALLHSESITVLPWRLSAAFQWNDKTKNEIWVQLGAGARVPVMRESELCISRSAGLNGAKWNQVALLLLLRGWSFRIWLGSCSELLPWIECWFQAQLSPIDIFQMAFSRACSSMEQAFPLSLLSFSRLLPILANTGQDLSCLPEVWSQCKLLSFLHWGKVLLSTCQIQTVAKMLYKKN